MGWFVGGLLILAVASIAYVLFISYRLKIQTEEDEESIRRKENEKIEQERIKQKRREKRRKESLKLEQEKIRATLRKELEPYLQGFITQNLSANKSNLKTSQYILKTGVVNIKDLMEYKVERKLADGTSYRVGLVKSLGEYEIGLNPDEVEQLQKYFADFFVLYDYLKSKGLKIDPLGLVDLISHEVEKTSKAS